MPFTRDPHRQTHITSFPQLLTTHHTFHSHKLRRASRVPPQPARLSLVRAYERCHTAEEEELEEPQQQQQQRDFSLLAKDPDLRRKMMDQRRKMLEYAKKYVVLHRTPVCPCPWPPLRV